MLGRGREARQAFEGCPFHQRAHYALHTVHRCRGLVPTLIHSCCTFIRRWHRKSAR
jgi:hypothetical protein